MRPTTDAQFAAALRERACYAQDSETRWLMETVAARIVDAGLFDAKETQTADAIIGQGPAKFDEPEAPVADDPPPAPPAPPAPKKRTAKS